MQHLTLEAIARLVDEPAGADEARHLGSCLVCRRELDEMRAQTVALARLPDPEPHPAAWRALEAALRDERLIRTAAPARRVVWSLPTARAAAAVALFLLGGASGAAVWSRLASPRAAPGDAARAPGAALLGTPLAEREATAPAAPASEPPAAVLAEVPVPAPARPAVSFAAQGGERGPSPPAPRRRTGRPTAADAAAAELVRARSDYLAALQRYAQLADPASGADEATRLRALNGLVATTRAAVELAPGDSVINGYHMAAVEERDQLLRRMARQSESTWF